MQPIAQNIPDNSTFVDYTEVLKWQYFSNFSFICGMKLCIIRGTCRDLFQEWNTRIICFLYFWFSRWTQQLPRDFETISGNCLFDHGSGISSVELIITTCRVKLLISFLVIFSPFLFFRLTINSSPFRRTLT